MTEGDLLSLEFPRELPLMGLSQNSRGNLHWARRAKLVDEDKNRWGWLLKARAGQGDRLWFLSNGPPYEFSWLVRWPDRRNRDADNVMSALKTCIDAMVNIGFLDDDSAAIIPKQSIELSFGSKDPGTELRISPGTRNER